MKERRKNKIKILKKNISKKVAALKRVCLNVVPRVLLLHAKRFEFDLDYMKRVKLNDKFAFPRTLNVAQYTLEVNIILFFNIIEMNNADHSFVKNFIPTKQ